MSRLASFVDRRRRAVLVLAGVLFAVGVAVGGPLPGLLGAGPGSFQDPNAENRRAIERIEAATGRPADFGLAALVPPSELRAFRRELRRTPEVTSLEPSSPRTRDGRYAVVLAQLGTDDEADVAAALRERAGPGVLIGGADVTFDTIGHKVSEDLARAELLAFPLLFLLSFWVFRSLVAALLPPLIGGLSIVTTFVALRAYDAYVSELSVFAVNLVTGIGLGLAIDYSLFVVSRFREEVAAGADRPTAVRRTLSTAGRTVVYSALTIAAAMASLLVFPLQFLSSMGVGGVIVALVAAVVSMTVLPALLAVLGPKLDAGAPRRLRRAAGAEAATARDGRWYRLAAGVMRRPGAVALGTSALLVACALPFLRVEFVSADHKVLPVGSEVRVVAETIQRDLPAVPADPLQAVALAPGGQADDVRDYWRAVRAVDGIGRVAPPRRLDSGTWLVQAAVVGDPLSERNLDVVRAVRELSAAFPVLVAGAGAEQLDQQRAIADRLPLALGVIAVTTFAILFLMTGSVVLPLKALVMNLLSVSAAFGLLVLVFQDGRLESVLDFETIGGLEATQPVLLFAIAFGLSTDYGVFLLSRIKEARDRGLPDREAVAFGVERTGRIITAAALLFCVAIGAFATSGVLFIKQVGVGTALAVAIDATIIRALLVPALMALLGRWNWWAPRPLQRLHARFGLAET